MFVLQCIVNKVSMGMCTNVINQRRRGRTRSRGDGYIKRNLYVMYTERGWGGYKHFLKGPSVGSIEGIWVLTCVNLHYSSVFLVNRPCSYITHDHRRCRCRRRSMSGTLSFPLVIEVRIMSEIIHLPMTFTRHLPLS